MHEGERLLSQVRSAGLHRGDPLALVIHPQVGGALGLGEGSFAWAGPLTVSQRVVTTLEAGLRPRWVWWSAATARPLVAAGVRVATCWDAAAVHRLLDGGTADDPSLVWAYLQGLDPAGIPRTGQLDLLSARMPPAPTAGGQDRDSPLDDDNHLRAEWVAGGWARDVRALQIWASLVFTVRGLQRERLRERSRIAGVSGDVLLAAHAESAAALLCAELDHDGLPVDVGELERLVEAAAGPRPTDSAQAARLRLARDEQVLRHLRLPQGSGVDLRNPVQVRAALAGIGIDVPDTRSWRLEAWRGHHRFVDALVAWRKADRIATTYGYSWLDRFVGADQRLRGPWSGSDGAAGRMTAGAGLHNLPAELRPGVAAHAGHVLLRADLGQIEPRVLAAVSGDPALASATREDDLYAPVAAALRVDRSVAKVAVLAAMYGQTSGTAGEALKGLRSGYPVAMEYLRRASDAGRHGGSVFTHGGRQVRMWSLPGDVSERDKSALMAARGRFARNAVVQGAAAELFKTWAVTVRALAQPLGASIVLCLHDELLLHVPLDHAEQVGALLTRTLDEVGERWAPGAGVRFVADVRAVQRWSQAKE